MPFQKWQKIICLTRKKFKSVKRVISRKNIFDLFDITRFFCLDSFKCLFTFFFQIQRLAREERDMLTHQVNTLTTQVDAQHQVVRKLEEKERLLQTNLAAMDKELSMRQQAMEMHKRKAIESAQSAADLKLHLEKYHAQIKEMQQTVAEKTSS